MLREAENRVKIEGVLSEIDLKYGSFMKDGKPTETIGGVIKIQVDQQIGGVPTTLEIPVHMFSTKYTKKGALNPAFESIERVMNEYVSIPIAATSGVEPDKVRITSARIDMNEYFGQNGQLISFPRITTSFVARATGTFKPEATFSAEFMVSNVAFVVDKEGVEVEPKKIEVTAILPRYGEKVDVIKLVATNPNVIDAIEQYWQINETFKANGRLNFTSQTHIETQEVDFGEPTERVVTTSLSELVITGGSQTPLEGDFAFDVNDIKKALAERKERLNALKAKGTNKKAPAPAASAGIDTNDLGF
ncbi:MAG: hypothetical protein GX762_02750 [Bacteroidales bacterium]|nr:hypothetical protein [Bacteroidales bacterium]